MGQGTSFRKVIDVVPVSNISSIDRSSTAAQPSRRCGEHQRTKDDHREGIQAGISPFLLFFFLTGSALYYAILNKGPHK
jgi:hypothetical protein